MKRLGLSIAIATMALGSASAAQANDYDDRWYFGGTVGGVHGSTHRDIDNWSEHFGLNFGRFFTPDFSLDLRADRYRLDFDNRSPAAGERFRLRSYGLVGRYHLGDHANATRPYLMLGAGIQEHRNPFDNGRDVFGSVGAGVMHRFNDRVSMRFELEHRYDNDRDTFDRNRGFRDNLVTLGLNVSIGDRATAPAPVEPPPPPPPARPATPPPPPPPPPPPAEPEVVFEFDAMVTFALDSATLRQSAIAQLDEAVALLVANPEIRRIEVAGHTCDLGSAQYNQGLSERRAQAVRDYLVANGISANRLVVRGYGEDRPKLPNTSDSNRQQNRRVELVVLERAR